MYQLIFYVPVSHLGSVKSALFKAGAGRIGDYDCCAWQTLGDGQYRPLAASNAFIGTKNQMTKIAEYKVEMVCSAEIIQSALQALINSHPYEMPAYAVLEIKTVENFDFQSKQLVLNGC
ncbi:structural toxin protein RtxA [Psychromonas ingrahamii 37]|uniref:Structural toxin protein RtxA n=1 Tax=Psychromonas ingrahamii (strain DSM 17664 / CCUG 51855 / 37) TaxID=357804 RepID=A1SSR9_PSYIN|nr:structural toxin protein RtxA [Psychromonas ingrahamii]ABM02534.1 structural toxin protein RtxA [Psychromonas ingrahamii 37]